MSKFHKYSERFFCEIKIGQIDHQNSGKVILRGNRNWTNKVPKFRKYFGRIFREIEIGRINCQNSAIIQDDFFREIETGQTQRKKLNHDMTQ